MLEDSEALAPLLEKQHETQKPGAAKIYLQSLLIGAIVNFKHYWKLINEKVTTKKEGAGIEGVAIITKTWGLVCLNGGK